jgi:uncharacterized protein YggE
VKRPMRVTAGLAALLILTNATLLTSADAAASITVSGTSALRVPPDRVSFSVGVETNGASVAQAFDSNRKKLDAVIGALKAKGVQPKEIQTSNLEISSRDETGKRIVGYRVSALVTVTRDDTRGVGDLLQAAITAGANQAGSLGFSVADPAQFRSRGLELAFQEARGKAEALASLSKRTLGPVVSVTEANPWNRSALENNLMSLGYVGGGGVQSGSEQVTFAITVVFELH